MRVRGLKKAMTCLFSGSKLRTPLISILSTVLMVVERRSLSSLPFPSSPPFRSGGLMSWLKDSRVLFWGERGGKTCRKWREGLVYCCGGTSATVREGFRNGS